MTAADVEREDDVSAIPAVARVDTAIVQIEAEVVAARAALRTQARAAARAHIAGEKPRSGLASYVARINELEVILAGVGELRIIAEYGALESLAQDADANSESLRTKARAHEARLDGIHNGTVDLGPAAKISDIPRIDALNAAESARAGCLARSVSLTQEAMRFRNDRARLKRTHADLFAAEGIA